VCEVVEPVVGADESVSLDECERERRVDGRNLGVGCRRRPGGGVPGRSLPGWRHAVPRRRVARAVGDGSRERRFEERDEFPCRGDSEPEVVGVDVFHVVCNLVTVGEFALFDAVAGQREGDSLRRRLGV
jgi:hypothetical protein